MKIAYQSFNFSPAYAVVIDHANTIIAQYAAQGHDMTLRQLYYQFVARDLFPDKWQVRLPTGEMVKNHDRNYKRLGEAISNGRMAGLVDWSSIKDRSRSLTTWHSDTSPADAIQAARRRYRLARWTNQPCRVEVWVEKDALAAIMEQVCGRYDVPVFACRGYVSQSAQWEAHRRHKYNYDVFGQPTTILHFGDHDPSGIDMTRDVLDRMFTFNEHYGKGDLLNIKRLALNMDQVKQYNPPPAPAKGTDPRFAEYEAMYGGECWELDALSPDQLSDLVTSTLDTIIDPDLWQDTLDREAADHLKFDKAIAAISKKPRAPRTTAAKKTAAKKPRKKKP